MAHAIITIHSAARRKAGYSEPLALSLGHLGLEVWLYETNWADLGDPSTHGDPSEFGEIRREFFRQMGVPSIVLGVIEPENLDPADSPGSAFDPILVYGFLDKVRAQVQRRLLAQLDDAADDGFERVTIIAHSMGSVVAFDVLERLGDPETLTSHAQSRRAAGKGRLPEIEMLVTLGSPLWMPVFDERHERHLTSVGSWMNLFHTQDFIGRPLLPAFGKNGPCPPFDIPISEDAPKAAHSRYWTSQSVALTLHSAWEAVEH